MSTKIEPWKDGSTVPTDVVPGALYVDLPGPDVRAGLDEARGRAEELLSILDRHVIDSTQAADQLGQVLQDTHAQIQGLEKQRKTVKAPALLATKEIDSFFRPTTAALKKVKTKITNMIGAWTREQDRARRATLAEFAKGAAPATAIAPPTAAPAGVAFRDELKIEIVDFDKIPREFLCVDMSALKILAKAGGQAPAGVRFERVSKPVVGR